MRISLPLAVGGVAAAVAFGGVMLLSDEEQRATSAPVRDSEPVAVGTTGHAVFNRMGCGGCHRLAAANSSGPIGPALDHLESHTAESLRAVILSPPAGSPMPRDFGERMTDAELDALVAFLLDAGR